MPTISRMTDQELDQRYEDLQAIIDAGDPDDDELDRIYGRMRAIEREQDARAAWAQR